MIWGFFETNGKSSTSFQSLENRFCGWNCFTMTSSLSGDLFLLVLSFCKSSKVFFLKKKQIEKLDRIFINEWQFPEISWQNLWKKRCDDYDVHIVHRNETYHTLLCISYTCEHNYHRVVRRYDRVEQLLNAPIISNEVSSDMNMIMPLWLSFCIIV